MMIDDIPEVIRENTSVQKSSPSLVSLAIGGVLAVNAIAFIAVFFFSWLNKSQPQQIVRSTPKIETEKPAVTKSSLEATTPAKSAQPPQVKQEDLLGHLPYQEVAPSELTAITPDGRVKMRSAAAAKFQEMQAAAKEDGIDLVAISGFRSMKDQEKLFFEVKEQRVQNASKRAEVSAPPGYSEHHTGYTVDIGDGDVPAVNVEPGFENTPAFRWLQANAAKYSFELSFPRNNPQGISYEPWHWRFVGDRHSLETFYKAREVN